uniref:Macaca fascicularis brain cDNA, clone: QtrA-15781 n=1 Tax=Macaca fascicularis TaxID=9541 RepID=I7GEL7_MACFA|nr:unnamed protein product [Macaca fascicularis]
MLSFLVCKIGENRVNYEIGKRGFIHNAWHSVWHIPHTKGLTNNCDTSNDR